MRYLLFLFIIFLITVNAQAEQVSAKSHHLTNGGFKNPQNIGRDKPTKADLWRFFAQRFTVRNKDIKVPADHVLTEQQALAGWQKHKNQNSITWLGHATFLIHLNGKTILTDPFLTDVAGVWKIGPKRYVAPAISIKNLPPINIITVSHNHYDSLDLKTLKQLQDKSQVQVVVPLGIGAYFKRYDYKNIHELDWHQSVTVDGIKIIEVPAIHFSSRTLWDRNKDLWAGFIIKSKSTTIFFSGDTRYGNKLFKAIGKRYGPIDYAIIGIGAYLPQNVMKYSHTTPEQALQIAKDLKANTLIAMHWGTIVLSNEPQFEPPKKLRAAAKLGKFPMSHVWILKIGETRELAE